MKTRVVSIVAVVLSVVACASASEVRVTKSSKGWQLLVDGKPYIVKGVCYAPTKVGESPDNGTWRDWMIVDDDGDGKIDAPYQSWVDKNRNNKRDADEPVVGDFQLMKEMGVNTIRIYHHPTTSPELQAVHSASQASAKMYNHAPNKALLRDLFSTYGIRVAMGDMLGSYTVGSGADWFAGTDYLDPEQRKKMLASVEDMVREFKDEPYLLMWVLGNENNYPEFTHVNASEHPVEYAQFVNEAARRIHELDPKHPVALCNGETLLLDVYAKHAPEVDIFGLNSYRKPDFGTLWEEVARTYDKPVLLTEFGVGCPVVVDGKLDEDNQASIHRTAWKDVAAHTAGRKAPGNAIGGFVFEFVDQWWQDYAPNEQNTNPEENGWNHEYNGLVSQGDGSDSPFMRQLRKAYFTYQKMWK